MGAGQLGFMQCESYRTSIPHGTGFVMQTCWRRLVLSKGLKTIVGILRKD